nr:MAG TPA_asm: hypothetical protein [Caudoviricetes sp.]
MKSKRGGHTLNPAPIELLNHHPYNTAKSSLAFLIHMN